MASAGADVAASCAKIGYVPNPSAGGAAWVVFFSVPNSDMGYTLERSENGDYFLNSGGSVSSFATEADARATLHSVVSLGGGLPAGWVAEVAKADVYLQVSQRLAQGMMRQLAADYCLDKAVQRAARDAVLW